MNPFKLSLLLSLSFFTLGHAYTEVDSSYRPCQKSCEVVYDYTETPCEKPCETVALCEDPCLKKWECGRFEVTGEFLYWQPRISGMAYAATNILVEVSPGFSLPSDVDFASVKFDYKPGFRIGARYTLPSNGWDLDSSWTSFKASGSDSIVATPGKMISTFWDPVGFVSASSASSNLKVDLQNVDINIGKHNEYFGCFTLRPYVGASYYLINVDNHINYNGDTILTVPGYLNAVLKDHSQGWGLNIGADSLWKLPCGFSLYGQGSYSLFCNNNVNEIKQNLVAPDAGMNSTFTTKNSFVSFSNKLKIACGLAWDWSFCTQNHPIDVNIFAGYEINYWPTEIEVDRGQFGGNNNSLIPLDANGSVGFHGLTTGLSITF